MASTAFAKDSSASIVDLEEDSASSSDKILRNCRHRNLNYVVKCMMSEYIFVLHIQSGLSRDTCYCSEAMNLI
jgi:hypothetical protein